MMIDDLTGLTVEQLQARIDAYKTGDQVTHKGGVWTSNSDGNVWEPGVYGWTG